MKDDRILCLAGETGKIIVNKCLDRGLYINTLKLEKLLILSHGIMLSIYQKPLFHENIIAVKHGLMIPKVDKEFIMYGTGFKDCLPEYIRLLDKEKKVIDEVIETYGSFPSTFELQNLKPLKVLHDLLYKDDEKTLMPITPVPIPNDLIERVFDYYAFYDFDIVKDNEKSFQKRMINKYINKNNS